MLKTTKHLPSLVVVHLISKTASRVQRESPILSNFTFLQIVSILKRTFIGKLMIPVEKCGYIPT